MHTHIHTHTQNELREAGKRASTPGRTASSTWLELLDSEAATWVGVLVAEEVGRTLRRSDLDKLLELVEVLPQVGRWAQWASTIG